MLAALALGNCAASAQHPPSPLHPIVTTLAHAPLDTPLVVTGGFGEFRQGHFHAGLDFSTGHVVGKSVYAPLDGWIERVRSSGVGYGRSVYLHASDGRLLVFGHLDAYEEPLASWVASKQDSSGQYEQDLWPEPERFPVRAGQRLAWSGQSGAGGPHLHFEIRRGDMALNPLRAGLAIRDANQPSIASVTLEPLDEESFVAGGHVPYTLKPGTVPDTVKVAGRVRVVVGARDGIWGGVDRMVPWSTALTYEGHEVDCRFDSVSWATDMPEAEYVYDVGRVTGDSGLILWAPPGFRPRVVVASDPPPAEAGTVDVGVKDQMAVLDLRASDVGGNSVTARLVLWPNNVALDRESSRMQEMLRQNPISRASDVRSVGFPSRLEFSSLPLGGSDRLPRLRISVVGGRAGECDELELGSDRALLSGNHRERAAIIAAKNLPFSSSIWLSGGDGASAWRAKGPELDVSSAVNGGSGRSGDLSWTIPTDALFEPAILVAEKIAKPKRTGELLPVGDVVALHPDTHPLRKALVFRFGFAGATPLPGTGLYRKGTDGWELIRTRFDADGRFFEGESRRLGPFALFRDLSAPRIAKLAPPRHAPKGAYSHWALEARLTENGSDVDARATYFSVDGKRVASEWDSEQHLLRWRPLAPPPIGKHRYEVVAADRAGNIARSPGTFVLD